MALRTWTLGLCAALTLAACGTPARQPAPSGQSSGAPAAAAPLSLTSIQAATPLLATAGYSLQANGPQGLSLYTRGGASGLELLVNAGGTVVAVRGVFPTETGLQPWFDQAATPATLGGSAGGVPSSAASVASSGTSGGGPSSSAAPAASASPPRGGLAQVTGQDAPLLPVPASPAAPERYTETIWLVPAAQAKAADGGALPEYSAVADSNVAFGRASQQSAFVAGRGAVWGPAAYGISALVNRGGQVVGFSALFPTNGGWQPMFDQDANEVTLVPARYLRGYTQHIYLVSQADLR